jgi:hypothetical protein
MGPGSIGPTKKKEPKEEKRSVYGKFIFCILQQGVRNLGFKSFNINPLLISRLYFFKFNIAL